MHTYSSYARTHTPCIGMHSSYTHNMNTHTPVKLTWQLSCKLRHETFHIPRIRSAADMHARTHHPHTHATHAHTSTPRAPGLHVAACGRETPWLLLDIYKTPYQNQDVSLQTRSYIAYIIEQRGHHVTCALIGTSVSYPIQLCEHPSAWTTLEYELVDTNWGIQKVGVEPATRSAVATCKCK